MGRGLALVAAVFLFACGSNDKTDATDHNVGGGDEDATTIQSGTLIRIADGQLQGSAEGGARKFLGIPYAKPPVGDLRWKAPEAAEAWDGVRDANQFGSACAQPSWAQGPESLDEDCLYLNVWTPDPAPTSPLPVMVWLPGGGNRNGSAADDSPLTGGTLIYDGQDLASTRHVVIVTLNYRLGVMGFFAHAGLRAEGSVSGNQGLQDQQAALKWVQQNIDAFGGDPTNVTLFGESAGSQDTCAQVMSPGGHGLFSRAMSESGGCTTYKKTRADAEQEAEAFAQAVGCSGVADELACLRGKPVSDLLIEAPSDGGTPDAPGGSQFSGSTPRWEFNLIVDGEVIPDQPRTLVDSGNFNKVPYLLGSNFEEGKLFLLPATPVMTETEYLDALNRLYGTAATTVAQQYPVSDFATPQDALIRVWGDFRLGCSTYDTARRVAAQGADVHLYVFSRSIPGLEGLGPTHGVEMPYVFGTLNNPPSEDAALSDTVQGYWTRFASTSDPNGESALEWPAFDETTDQRMNFDINPTVVSGYRRAECDMWETIYAAQFQ